MAQLEDENASLKKLISSNKPNELSFHPALSPEDRQAVERGQISAMIYDGALIVGPVEVV